jgi:hypothetical protein
MANSPSMYSITENIYCSQLSSVAILLQPEPNCFTSYNTRKGLCSFSLCAIVLRSPPPLDVSTSNGQRSSHLFCVHYTKKTSSVKVQVFRDGTRRDAAPEDLSQQDASRNGVPELFSWQRFYEVRRVLLSYISFQQANIFCTVSVQTLPSPPPIEF